MNEVTITRDNFSSEVLQSDMPVLLDVWATWCGPCKMLVPVLEQFAAKHPEIKVGKINVDEEDILAAQHGIMSIPCLVVYRDGKIADQTVGYMSLEKLEAFMNV